VTLVDLVREIGPYAALAAVALGVILLILVIALWVGLRRLRRAQAVVLGHHEQRDLVTHAEELDAQVRNMREAVERLTLELETQRARLDDTLTNRAIVRYDAFRDAGGEQSATLALLDNRRSGFVLSTIAARDFARVYVKHLRAGVPDRDLSPEEEEAILAAVPQPLPASPDQAAQRRGPARAQPPPDGDEPSRT
jgi:hypothetical protein